jgi:hypothetical protein
VASTSSTRSADTAARCDWATIMPSIRSGQMSMAMYTLNISSEPMLRLPSSTWWPP